VALAGVGAATAAARALGANATTAGFVYLVVVLLAAARLGFPAAVAASLSATACYNRFFLPPIGTWTIADPANWVALAVFLLASVLVSRLVANEQRRAEEAEARRMEVEALLVERERFLEERAHHEALRESDAFRTSLLRAVSHDLRTPITALRLGLERLRRSAADSADVDALSAETERLSRRIDNLLSMARLDAGTSVPRPEPAPPADLFRGALDALPLVLAGRRVTVTVAEDTPDALADPTLAVEILTNLLENAARAAKPETPLELAAGPDPAGPEHVRLEVRDRGPGVPAGLERPSQAGPSAETGRGGLGLVICGSLARAMGGTVTLLERPGGGTVARLELPAAPGGAG
jgi:two-component system sensor histidine kinase KdpD